MYEISIEITKAGLVFTTSGGVSKYLEFFGSTGRNTTFYLSIDSLRLIVFVDR